jgi:transketolase
MSSLRDPLHEVAAEMAAHDEELGLSEVDRLCIDTIRTLSIDAVQAANSGHPGAPLSLAPAAYVLFRRIMRHNPADPKWPDRDRFVLSAGHASMLLYASLHLAGYDLSLGEIKRFRQLGSLTPGHPEVHHTAGVETTTGPLGQGFANGVGMAMAERFLRERYGSDVVDHRIFAICSDGDLMEGISSEAASIAGHLGLGRLVYLYDDNRITIDGSTELSFSEDVEARFSAQGWHTLRVEDGEDVAAIEQAIRAGIAEQERPTLIRLTTIIAHHAPTRRGTSKAHGEALGTDEVAATKEALGWDPEQHFLIPDRVYEHFRDHCRERGAREQQAWQERFDAWAGKNGELAEEWRDGQAGKVGNGLAAALPTFDPAETPKIATRAASGKVFEAISPFVPTMVGGAADLVGSTKTIFPGEPSYSREHAGRNVHWGVREHAMAAAVNGLALHGGIVKPYGSTFFVFTDYMRPSIRLSALMGLDVLWVLTHDSVAVGEDGPTHEPIEHLASLRAMPGLTLLRPADAAETVEAWRVALEEVSGPAMLVLTRQDLPVLDRTALASAEGVGRGAYVLADADSPDAILAATGSEVWVALAARDLLAERGVQLRIVSMPSWELFAAQSADYRQDVLPAGVPKISLEAASTFGWSRWVDRSIGIDTFGASGPGAAVLAHYGIAPEPVAARVEELIGELALD